MASTVDMVSCAFSWPPARRGLVKPSLANNALESHTGGVMAMSRAQDVVDLRRLLSLPPCAALHVPQGVRFTAEGCTTFYAASIVGLLHVLSLGGNGVDIGHSSSPNGPGSLALCLQLLQLLHFLQSNGVIPILLPLSNLGVRSVNGSSILAFTSGGLRYAVDCTDGNAPLSASLGALSAVVATAQADPSASGPGLPGRVHDPLRTLAPEVRSSLFLPSSTAHRSIDLSGQSAYIAGSLLDDIRMLAQPHAPTFTGWGMLANVTTQLRAPDPSLRLSLESAIDFVHRMWGGMGIHAPQFQPLPASRMLVVDVAVHGSVGGPGPLSLPVAIPVLPGQSMASVRACVLDAAAVIALRGDEEGAGGLSDAEAFTLAASIRQSSRDGPASTEFFALSQGVAQRLNVHDGSTVADCAQSLFQPCSSVLLMLPRAALPHFPSGIVSVLSVEGAGDSFLTQRRGLGLGSGSDASIGQSSLPALGSYLDGPDLGSMSTVPSPGVGLGSGEPLSPPNTSEGGWGGALLPTPAPPDNGATLAAALATLLSGTTLTDTGMGGGALGLGRGFVGQSPSASPTAPTPLGVAPVEPPARVSPSVSPTLSESDRGAGGGSGVTTIVGSPVGGRRVPTTPAKAHGGQGRVGVGADEKSSLASHRGWSSKPLPPLSAAQSAAVAAGIALGLVPTPTASAAVQAGKGRATASPQGLPAALVADMTTFLTDLTGRLKAFGASLSMVNGRPVFDAAAIDVKLAISPGSRAGSRVNDLRDRLRALQDRSHHREDVVLRGLSALGMLDVTLAALQVATACARDSVCASYSLQAIGNLAMEDKNRVRMAGLGAIEMVTATMATFGGMCIGGTAPAVGSPVGSSSAAGRVLKDAVVALRHLSYENDLNKVRVLESGGMDCIVQAMNACADNSAVQRQACGALTILAVHSSMGDAAKARIVAAGGLAAAVRALTSHKDDAQLFLAGMKVLATLVNFPDAKSVAQSLTVDGVPVLEAVEELERHGGEAGELMRQTLRRLKGSVA